MSEEIMKGAFEATSGNMRNILTWASAPLDTEKYNKCWFNLSEDSLRTIGNAGKALAAYCTFGEPMVQDIELHDSVDPEAGLESLMKIPQAEDYLSFVGGERVRVEFWGMEDRRGASKVVFDGDLRAEFFVPNNESDYDSILLEVANKFNDNDVWISGEGDELSTSFRTTVNQFERIVEAKEFDHLALSNFPVVIEDGEFRLDATDANERDTISGVLNANDVSGPDVENHYTRGFSELFSNISGEVEVHTEQDSVVSIVRKSNDDAMTLRYSILPVAS